MSVDAAGPSVLVHDDPTSRGPTAAAADTSAADPQPPAAPGAAAAAESTHVTPGTVSVIAAAAAPRRDAGLYHVTFSLLLQQQIQEVFKNQQEQLSMQLLQQKNAGIVSQEVSEAHSGILFMSWWIFHRCICYSMRTRELVQVSFPVNKSAPHRFSLVQYLFKYCKLPDFNLSMSLPHVAMPEALQTLNK